jgi:cytoskeletal protein RodZ
MALSMDEQRILDQIERGLASADPALATRMASFGAPRRITALRMRRLRLVASLMTLLVVASVSLVVYALVPFRSVTDRHAGGKASSPAHPVMTAPSHPGHSSPKASAGQASAGQASAGQASAGQASAGQASAAPASAAPASTSPALGTSASASSAASQAPSTHAGASASPASAQQPRRTPAQ